MKSIIHRVLAFTIMVFAGFIAVAQSTASKISTTAKTPTMKTYLIERDIPGAGKLHPRRIDVMPLTYSRPMTNMHY